MSPANTYEVVSSSVNVRTGPSASNTKVARYVRGTKITGKKRSDGWISFTASSGKTRYLYGSSTYVKVVSSPSRTSTKAGTLSVGERATASPSQNGYMRTTYEDKSRFPDVFGRKNTSSRYDVHYIPSGGMVKGVVEGSWFKLGPTCKPRWAT